MSKELSRLSRYAPQQSGLTTLFGGNFEFTEARSLIGQYTSFFVKRTYAFTAQSDTPKIIDCGANIGVSVMWWKYLYPKAEVVAFEPDPRIFEVLRANCGHLEGVTLHNAAVWKDNGEKLFAALGGEGGRLIETSDDEGVAETVRVRTVRLREFLENGCDFLKIDIEGAEVEVVNDCKDLLNRARLIFLEFHSFFHRKQALGNFLHHLDTAGFRMHIHTGVPSPTPFCELLNFNQKDLRLNIFCFKDGEYPTIRVVHSIHN